VRNLPDIYYASSLNVLFPSVFRELLQNSDDAESPTVEVHFETAAYLDRRDRREEILDVPTLPDLKSTSVLALGPSHAHVFADHIFQGYAMDVQKQWENVYRQRLEETPEDWCVDSSSFPSLFPIPFFTCQLKETLAQRRSVPSVSVSRIYFLQFFYKCWINYFSGFYSLFSVTDCPFVSSGGIILSSCGFVLAQTPS
jgi:hypothetical protein